MLVRDSDYRGKFHRLMIEVTQIGLLSLWITLLFMFYTENYLLSSGSTNNKNKIADY